MTKIVLIGVCATLGACSLYWGDSPGGPTTTDPTPTPTPTTPDATPTPVYQLVKTRSLASPIHDPSGITYDGSKLWIIAGAPPSNNSTLVGFDPDDLAVAPSFTYDNLQETLGSAVFGITWLGDAVWIAVAGNTNKLVRVDPTNGQSMQTMGSPTQLGPVDLDFDGTNLWVGTGIGQIEVVDPTTGGVVRTLSLASPDRDNGVAVHPGEVWVGKLFGDMVVLDPVTGAIVASVVHDDGSELSRDEIGPSVFVGEQLVIASEIGITYYDIVR